MGQGLPTRRPCRRHRAATAGFSLYELTVTLAVVGVLLGTGVPLMRAATQSARLTTAVNGLVTALHLARSTAITRAVPVSLCPSTDGQFCDPRDGPLLRWQGGWLVFVNADAKGERDPSDELLRMFDGGGGDLAILASARRPRVTYRATGLAPATNLTFSFCDTRGPDAARTVIVSNSGRPRVAQRRPDGRPPDCPTGR